MYSILLTTNAPNRTIMLTLYNHIGIYNAKETGNWNYLKSDIKFHIVKDFIREHLIPHLQIN